MEIKKTKRMLKRILRYFNIYTSEEYKVAYNAVKRGIHYRNKPLFNELNKDVIFIHIPKAAGVSVVKALYGTESSCHAFASDYLEQNPHRFQHAQVISLVRNPYSRLTSAYNYLMQGGRCEIDEVWRKLYLSPYKDINDFVQNGLKKAIYERAEHFIPQVQFIYKEDELLVDYVGKVEDISSFEHHVSNLIGKNIRFSKENKSHSLKNSNMLTTESILVINELYKQDFESFKYEIVNVGDQ